MPLVHIRKQNLYRIVNVLLFRTIIFLFCNKMLVIKAGIHKIANNEDPDQKKSDLGLCCLSRHFSAGVAFEILYITFNSVYKQLFSGHGCRVFDVNIHLCPNSDGFKIAQRLNMGRVLSSHFISHPSY